MKKVHQAKINNYQREKHKMELYKRIKGFIKDKGRKFCYITDGQKITTEICDEVIEEFDLNFHREKKLKEYNEYQDEPLE